jgi:hypothetical protein
MWMAPPSDNTYFCMAFARGAVLQAVILQADSARTAPCLK